MKYKIFIAAILLAGSLISFEFSSDQHQSQKYENITSVESTITYVRINIDGVWWIIVYEDGVKVNEYVDPDQA